MAGAPFTNILVAIDGTESAVKAAEYAIRLARGAPAKLTAVAVVDTDTLRKLMSVRILVKQEVAEFEAELGTTQRRYLNYVTQLAAKAGVALEPVLRTGACHSEILAEQKARGADLIVIGECRGTLTKMDLAARERQLILDQAPCPVLVVR